MIIKKSVGLVSVRVPRSARGNPSENSSIIFASLLLFEKTEQPIRMPKISSFFLCLFALAHGARKQNGIWREFLDFQDCQREGLKSDYGTLDFVTCGLDYGISRCYLQIECNDEDKR